MNKMKFKRLKWSQHNHFRRIEDLLQIIPRTSSGDVSKETTTRFKLHDLCDHFTFISHIEPKNIETEADSYWLLAMQEELSQFERNQVWHLIPRPRDRPTIDTK